MSTTRSQKRKNNQQESTESASEGLVSPITEESVCHLGQDESTAGHSGAKSPRVENSFLERLRASLKEEITSEIKNLLVEFQRKMLQLLKHKTGENLRGNVEDEPENESRSFDTPTKFVSINSTQNDDLSTSRNTTSSKVTSFSITLSQFIFRNSSFTSENPRKIHMLNKPRVLP